MWALTGQYLKASCKQIQSAFCIRGFYTLMQPTNTKNFRKNNPMKFKKSKT